MSLKGNEPLLSYCQNFQSGPHHGQKANNQQMPQERQIETEQSHLEDTQILCAEESSYKYQVPKMKKKQNRVEITNKVFQENFPELMGTSFQYERTHSG